MDTPDARLGSCTEVCAKTSAMSMETNASVPENAHKVLIVGDGKTFWHGFDSPKLPNSD